MKKFILEKTANVTDEEKNVIETKLLDGNFPWFFGSSMLTEPYNDNEYFFFHNLYLRNTDPNTQSEPNSNITYFFENIFRRFCEENKIEVRIIHRASLNLTNYKGKKETNIHKDHPKFEHKNFILYLTDNPDLGTKIYDEDTKTVLYTSKGSLYNVLVFDGLNHTGLLPQKIEQIRLVCVFTFS